MNRVRHERAKELFLAAADLTDEQRSQFLTMSCGDDATLRKEVESLLRHHSPQTVIVQSTAPTLVARPRLVDRGSSRAQRHGLPPSRLPLTLLLIALVLIIVVSVWLHWMVQRTLERRIESSLLTVLDADITALDHWISLQTADVEGWARDDDIRDLVRQQVQLSRTTRPPYDELKASAALAEITDLLEPVVEREGIHAVNIISPDGLDIASAPADYIGRSISPQNASYLLRLKQGETILAVPARERRSVAGIESNDQKPVLAIAAPVLDNGSMLAALVFGFRADHQFTQILSIADLGETGETYAFDQNAVLLSNVRSPESLQQTGLLQPGQTQSALYVDIRDPGGNLAAGFRTNVPRQAQPLTAMAAMATAGIDGANVRGYRNYRGQLVVGAWRWLPHYEFGVATEIPYDEAFHPMAYIRIASVTLLVMVSLLSLTTAFSTLSVFRLREKVGAAMQLGDYYLGELIGQGGMGKVYRARHAMLKRPAAIKLLNGQAADPATVARFEREVQLTCQLTHPNTIQIYDFGRNSDDIFYYAMEFLDGINLEELILVEGPISAARVIAILRQVTASLREAHLRGMIHRDVKPANVMLCERGGMLDVVKVLDFGLAKPIEAESADDITKPQLVSGTPHYIAPERLLGDASVDSRSDLYSLGSVAFYLLTGQHVFPENTAANVFYRTMNEDGPRPSSRLEPGDLPADLDSLVHACLARDPAGRPCDADSVLQSLDRLAADCPWTQQDARAWWARHASLLKRAPLVRLDEKRGPDDDSTQSA